MAATVGDPPQVQDLHPGLIAFVTENPTPDISLAVRQLQGSQGHVLAISPPRTQHTVLSVGANWANLTRAEEATEHWARLAARHGTSSDSTVQRNIRRWLILREVIRERPDIRPDTALVLVERNVLLFQDIKRWLHVVRSSPSHGASVAALAGRAVLILSPEALARFATYLRWLTAGPTSRLAAELDRFGVPAAQRSEAARPQLAVGSRHALLHRRCTNRSAARANCTFLRAPHRRALPADLPSATALPMWAEFDAVRAFCKRSKESSLAYSLLPIRCSLCRSEADPFTGNCASSDYREDHRAHLEQAYDQQPAGPCSTEYRTDPEGTVAYRMDSVPWGRSNAESVQALKPAPSLAGTDAGRWLASLRLRGTSWLVRSSSGHLHRLCLANLRGPAAVTAPYMGLLVSGRRQPSPRGGAALQISDGSEAGGNKSRGSVGDGGGESGNFLVLTYGRAGSTWFMEQLARYNCVATVTAEPLTVLQGWIPTKVAPMTLWQNWTHSQSAERVLHDLDSAFSTAPWELHRDGACRKPPCRIPPPRKLCSGEPSCCSRASRGMKVMLPLLPPRGGADALLSAAVERRWQVLHLIRASVIRRAISVQRMQITGVHHTKAQKESAAGTGKIDRIQVSPEALAGLTMDYVAMITRHRRAIRDAIPEARTLELFYEDVLMQRPGNRWRDILDFLAFAPRQPTAHQARELLQISPTTLVACERLVEQYDVLERLLREQLRSLKDDQQAILTYALSECRRPSGTPPVRRYLRR